MRWVSATRQQRCCCCCCCYRYCSWGANAWRHTLHPKKTSPPSPHQPSRGDNSSSVWLSLHTATPLFVVAMKSYRGFPGRCQVCKVGWIIDRLKIRGWTFPYSPGMECGKRKTAGNISKAPFKSHELNWTDMTWTSRPGYAKYRTCVDWLCAIGGPASRHMQLHRKAEKGTTFLLWINLLIRSVIWQHLVLLLLMNIIIDVTYLISGISTNFHRLLCKKCDVGYYVINHCVIKLMTTG